MQSTQKCSVEGCMSGNRLRRGLCPKHYNRLLRNGTTEGAATTPAGRRRCSADMTLLQRIQHIGYTVTPSGCWEWNGIRHNAGYPMLNWKRKRTYVHRVMLANRLGRELHPGMFACHHCDNPPCMNPDHLFPGTVQDNTADMWSKGRGRATGGPGGLAKYPKESIDNVFALNEQGTPRKHIAEVTGLSLSYVYALLNGSSQRPTRYQEN